MATRLLKTFEMPFFSKAGYERLHQLIEPLVHPPSSKRYPMDPQSVPPNRLKRSATTTSSSSNDPVKRYYPEPETMTEVAQDLILFSKSKR